MADLTPSTTISGMLVEIGDLIDHDRTPGLIVDCGARGYVVVLMPRENVIDVARQCRVYHNVTITVAPKE